MVICEDDGEPPARWLNRAGCCIQSNSGQRLTDSQMVCSDAEEKDFISFKHQTAFLALLRPVLCPFEKQPMKNPKAHHPCSSSCAPALLLWTQLAPHRWTLLLYPGSAWLLAVMRVSQCQMVSCILCRRQLSEQLQSKGFMVNSRTFPLSLLLLSKVCKNEPSSGSI